MIRRAFFTRLCIQSHGKMTIQLNGEQHDIQAGMSVAALLRQLEIRLDQVAVEVNLEIMDKGGFEARLLQDGDRVEVMSFIGGGAEGFDRGPFCISPNNPRCCK